MKVPEIKIRINDDRLIAELDRLTKEQNFTSRNKLIEHILTLYVLYKDRLFLDNLPPIIEEMCRQAVEKNTQKNDVLIRANINTLAKVERYLDDLRSIFYKELPPDYKDYNSE